MGLQGNKATHDFLSLYAAAATATDYSPLPRHPDSKPSAPAPPPAQDFFLKTHDFLPQVEKRADQTPPPPPPPPPHDAAAAAPRRHHHHHHPHLLRRNHPEAPRSASPPSLHLLHPAQIDPIWTDPIGKKNTHTRKKSPPKNNESIDQRVEKGKLRSANRSSWAARGGGGGAESN